MNMENIESIEVNETSKICSIQSNISHPSLILTNSDVELKSYPFLEEASRRVVQGNCGWSDSSLLSCKRFFPPKTSSSVEKLTFLSRHGLFGCIEVDSSTYQIPNPSFVKSWVDSTPKDFIFHMKAFGMFCSGSIEIGHLPIEFRNQYIDSSVPSTNTWVTLESLGHSGRKKLWDMFNGAVEPIKDTNKLGFILFQYHIHFSPSLKSREHIIYCANSLRSDYPMAIDFRDRTWVDEKHLTDTIAFLRNLRPEGVVLVASDDLFTEMHLRDSNNVQVDSKNRLPIVLTAKSCDRAAYIRVHRRVGNQRILGDDEIIEWVQRIQHLLQESSSSSLPLSDDNTSIISKSLHGPIFFMWATDHEDQPIINGSNLLRYLPSNSIFDCKKYFGNKHSIKNLLSKQQSTHPSSTINVKSSPNIPSHNSSHVIHMAKRPLESNKKLNTSKPEVSKIPRTNLLSYFSSKSLK